MAGHRKSLEVYLLCFLALIVSVCAKEYVPVLLWGSRSSGNEEISTPALIKWKSGDFYDYMSKKNHAYREKPLIVVFAEENLSVEDFSWQDVEGHSSYPLLEGLSRKSPGVFFIPSVHTPLQAFQDLKNNGYTVKTVALTSESQVPTAADADTVLIIKMDDAKSEEDRLNLLSRHDKIISNIYTQLLSKHPNMLAVYTGRYSSFYADYEPVVERVRRQAAENTTTGNGTSVRLWKDPESKAFLYFFKLFPILGDAADPKAQLELKNAISWTIDSRENLLRFVVVINENSRKITLRFRFSIKPTGYWTLPTIEYEEASKALFLTTSSDIEAANNFSYHCGEKIVFRNGSTTLTFDEIQMQLYPRGGKFSDSYDCTWFFTAPIWSGIFITVILALIMTWGITMIMDIKTMDRFDDPKGKPITISASE